MKLTEIEHLLIMSNRGPINILISVECNSLNSAEIIRCLIASVTITGLYYTARRWRGNTQQQEKELAIISGKVLTKTTKSKTIYNRNL